MERSPGLGRAVLSQVLRRTPNECLNIIRRADGARADSMLRAVVQITRVRGNSRNPRKDGQQEEPGWSLHLTRL